MTTRPSDPDGWYDPDGTDAATLRKIREERETTDRIIYAADEEVPDTTVRDLVKAYARIAELEAQVNHQRVWLEDAAIRHYAARIAELEAEVNHLQGENDRLREVRESRIAELEAEVDRLRDVLTETRDGANNLWAERDRLAADADYWMKRATRNL